jgi:hypothetical protein
VIFLINHRFAFYWYIPFFGASGFCALVARNVYDTIERRNPAWLAKSGADSVFALVCFGAFILHRDSTRYARAWVRERAVEYRRFVTGLKTLPPPSPGEIVYFDSKPSHFSETHLRSATQVALRRTDVDARFVSEFLSDARFWIRFREGHLRQVLTGKDKQRQNGR